MEPKLWCLPSPLPVSNNLLLNNEQPSSSDHQEANLIDLLIQKDSNDLLKVNGEKFLPVVETPSDFDEKVKKLIEELDSFQVKVSPTLPAKTQDLPVAESDAMSTDDSLSCGPVTSLIPVPNLMTTTFSVHGCNPFALATSVSPDGSPVSFSSVLANVGHVNSPVPFAPTSSSRYDPFVGQASATGSSQCSGGGLNRASSSEAHPLQNGNKPVLEATNLESLLEKFEATEIVSDSPTRRVTTHSGRKYKKVSCKRGPILIPPANRKRSSNFSPQNSSSSDAGASASGIQAISGYSKPAASDDAKDQVSSSGPAEAKKITTVGRSNPAASASNASEAPSANSCLSCVMHRERNSTNENNGVDDDGCIELDSGDDPLEGTSSHYVPVPKRKKSAAERNADRQKIIYVGRIPNSFNCPVLKSIFSKYGEVVNATIYFRRCGDNYGFVTFRRSEDAAKVLTSYLSDPDLNTFDVCYGARRAFCKRLYSDLGNQYTESSDDSAQCSGDLDFDRLLRDAKAKVARKN